MRIRYLLALMFALVLALPVRAETRPRIFVGTLEYTGPTITVDGTPYVDAGRFATAIGLAARTGDQGTAIGDAQSDLGSADGGLTINGKPFSGATRIDHGTLYVSLPDLATSLQGNVKVLPGYNTVKVTLPGLPTAAALQPQAVRKMVEVRETVAQYRLVEFYADW